MGNCVSDVSAAITGTSSKNNNNNKRKQGGGNGGNGGGGGKKLQKRASQQKLFHDKQQSQRHSVNLALIPKGFENVPNSKFELQEYKYQGAYKAESTGKVEEIKGQSILDGVKQFKQHPQLYSAIFYPIPMLDWPIDEQQYTLVYRAGTVGIRPKNPTPKGQVQMYVHEYTPLPKFPNNELPKSHRDKYTDNMTYRGKKLHSSTNKPILPGRGMGIVDDPTIKIIGEVNPSDVEQGQVGDCWLLSGIAALAEYDGAIRRLFRKTPNLDQMPFRDGKKINQYTITLWDLKTWTEVDIIVDERLCARADGSGLPLGAKPSTADNELWVCYLEKAIAAHCGGYDKIDGGQCTHAWALLTGCKEQYIIRRLRNGKFANWSKFNPETQQWAEHGNAPSDGVQVTWPSAWPKASSSSSETSNNNNNNNDLGDLTPNELFQRMCEWDEANYLIGAATEGIDDRTLTNGIVDNHAYTVVECRPNVCNTGIDLIQVRNPWGYGSIEKGMFGSDTKKGGGKGWKKYPQIKKELNPILDADDGLFWVTKEEFFKHYETIYLAAYSMTKFLNTNNNNNNKTTEKGPKRVAQEQPLQEPPSKKTQADVTTTTNTTTPEQPLTSKQQLQRRQQKSNNNNNNNNNTPPKPIEESPIRGQPGKSKAFDVSQSSSATTKTTSSSVASPSPSPSPSSSNHNPRPTPRKKFTGSGQTTTTTTTTPFKSKSVDSATTAAAGGGTNKAPPPRAKSGDLYQLKTATNNTTTATTSNGGGGKAAPPRTKSLPVKKKFPINNTNNNNTTNTPMATNWSGIQKPVKKRFPAQ